VQHCNGSKNIKVRQKKVAPQVKPRLFLMRLESPNSKQILPKRLMLVLRTHINKQMPCSLLNPKLLLMLQESPSNKQMLPQLKLIVIVVGLKRPQN